MINEKGRVFLFHKSSYKLPYKSIKEGVGNIVTNILPPPYYFFFMTDFAQSRNGGDPAE